MRFGDQELEAHWRSEMSLARTETHSEPIELTGPAWPPQSYGYARGLQQLCLSTSLEGAVWIGSCQSYCKRSATRRKRYQPYGCRSLAELSTHIAANANRYRNVHEFLLRHANRPTNSKEFRNACRSTQIRICCGGACFGTAIHHRSNLNTSERISYYREA